MKKLISGAVAILSCSLATVNAQNYQIDFAGTGESTTVESVDVQNITQGTMLTLAQGEILHLTNNVTSVNNINNNSKGLRIYPNPVIESGTIEFLAQNSGYCYIELYNLLGKKIVSNEYELPQGEHQFKITGLSKGIYAVKVQSDTYSYSGKLVSKGTSQAQAIVTFMAQKSATNEAVALKSTTESNIVDMYYCENDRLLITGKSGIYSTVKSIISNASTTITFDFVACTDEDGNNYKVVTIGTQTWMAENLRTTKYNDGTSIPLVTENSDWGDLTTPAYCWFNNDQTTAIANGYGALYIWYTVETDKLCPTGWHVPTDAEWLILEETLGMPASQSSSYAYRGTTEGTALKTTTGWKYDGNGTNSYGFSALPGGYRYGNASSVYGEFGNFSGIYGKWWSSTDDAKGSRGLHYNKGEINRSYGDIKKCGYSVRCLMD